MSRPPRSPQHPSIIDVLSRSFKSLTKMESLAAVETNTLSQQVLEYTLNTDGLDTSGTTGMYTTHQQQQFLQQLKGKAQKQAHTTANDTGVSLSTPGASKLLMFIIAAKEFSTPVAYGLANKFNKLEVEEQAKQFLDASDVSLTTGTKAKADVKYKAERLLDGEEACFSFRVPEQGYKHGIFDLLCASFVANAAIDLAKRMFEGIQNLLEKYGRFGKFINATYAVYYDKKHDERLGFHEQPVDRMDFRVYNQAEQCLCTRHIWCRGR
ncbi:hypothetical protein PAAG_03562 [Paracoccidioides lutzii Pb01]|uniref:Uncharacterized protein n=1 Tax=Paracoccidioides lutzii (strain ATCC MYA-826 / Pb01) TaxID=502779 RepID=C1GXI8_PARBA|nr:hypothetical protein PAAG_03562 [Paracoccidioides lutzii Pb01]EEH41276.2 hypothetical protein PAAG_03562 [Paracoccidioides lutzii Pb01]